MYSIENWYCKQLEVVRTEILNKRKQTGLPTIVDDVARKVQEVY